MYDYNEWYDVVSGDLLEQGDIINDVPIIVLPADWTFDGEPPEGKIIDAIVMSQSCDLQQNKVQYVLLCAVTDLDSHPLFPPTDYRSREELRRGYRVHYHLLNRCTHPDFERGLMVVEFPIIHSLPIDYLKNHAAAQSPRLRLKPPYREHLSQAFARVFMRVGLPSDIPPFTKATP